MYPPPIPVPVRKMHTASIWQLILGIFGVVSYFIVSALLAAVIFSNQSDIPAFPGSPRVLQEIFLMSVLFTIFFIPSIVLPIRRLRGKEPRQFFVGKTGLFIGLGLMVLWLVLVALGYFLKSSSIPDTVTVIMQVLGIILPILFLFLLAGYKLQSQSTQRMWGAFNFTQLVTFIVVCIFELLGVFLLLVIAGIWLAQKAEFLPYLSLLQNKGTLDEQTLQSLLTQTLPLLKTPLTYVVVVLSVSLFVPMIEEFFKPLAVWMFAGRKITPSEGFSLGLVCGAGFAALESLLMASMASGETWLLLIVGRAGTGLMHITTAALSGWALAKSWQDGKYLRVAVVYLGVILLHGIWNLFAVLGGVSDMTYMINAAWISSLSAIAYWILGGLAVLLVGILILVNHNVKREINPPSLPGTISQSE